MKTQPTYISLSGYKLRDLPRLLVAVYHLHRAIRRHGFEAVASVLEERAAQSGGRVVYRRTEDRA